MLKLFFVQYQLLSVYFLLFVVLSIAQCCELTACKDTLFTLLTSLDKNSLDLLPINFIFLKHLCFLSLYGNSVVTSVVLWLANHSVCCPTSCFFDHSLTVGRGCSEIPHEKVKPFWNTEQVSCCPSFCHIRCLGHGLFLFFVFPFLFLPLWFKAVSCFLSVCVFWESCQASVQFSRTQRDSVCSLWSVPANV